MTVLTIGALLTSIAVPVAARFLDGIAVRAAAREAYAVFSLARQLAITRGRMTALEVDTATATLIVRSEADTLRARKLGDVHGVRLGATRLVTTYAPNGLGYGVSNMTLVIRRGRASDTLVVSRLGRVRR